MGDKWREQLEGAEKQLADVKANQESKEKEDKEALEKLSLGLEAAKKEVTECQWKQEDMETECANAKKQLGVWRDRAAHLLSKFKKAVDSQHIPWQKELVR